MPLDLFVVFAALFCNWQHFYFYPMWVAEFEKHRLSHVQKEWWRNNTVIAIISINQHLKTTWVLFYLLPNMHIKPWHDNQAEQCSSAKYGSGVQV